jgi:hypothetical protein
MGHVLSDVSQYINLASNAAGSLPNTNDYSAFTFLFVYDLFNDVVSSADYRPIVSYSRVILE